MARLIVKSPYIKCGNKGGAEGYLKYIGTREHVEVVPDDRPPTRKQAQLIRDLVRDFPDTKFLDEYKDYTASPTKARASSLINFALENNWGAAQHSEVYARYIATRPRAERLGSHGLFGDVDNIDLDMAMAELQGYTGNAARMQHGSVTTTQTPGAISSAPTATTSRRRCTSRRTTSVGTPRSTMREIILMST